MATPKRARATSSTPRSKKSAATSAQENGNGHASFQQTHSNGNVEEAIRVRAYQLFEQRGRVHGYDVEDWVRAKTEI